MVRRSKVLVVCDSIDKELSECLEWDMVLREHIDNKKIITHVPDRRIETPFAIIDFVWQKPIITSGYKFIVNAGENDEEVLRIAIGE